MTIAVNLPTIVSEAKINEDLRNLELSYIFPVLFVDPSQASLAICTNILAVNM